MTDTTRDEALRIAKEYVVPGSRPWERDNHYANAELLARALIETERENVEEGGLLAGGILDLQEQRDESEKDAVNPSHYQGDLVMRIIEHFKLDESFYLGNVVKYVLRHRDKAGLEDLKKARWYLDRTIAALEGQLPKGTIK